MNFDPHLGPACPHFNDSKIVLCCCRGIFLLPGKLKLSQATSPGDVPGKWQQTIPDSTLMFSHLKSRTNATFHATTSDCRLISLAPCSHHCIFLIFQHSCSVWHSIPLNYFYLSFCLNELIYIFSPQILHHYFMPVLLSSTVLFVSDICSRAVTYIFTSSAVSLNSHINEDTCKKSESSTNPFSF